MTAIKDKILIQYKTEDGTTWPTLQQAILAQCLESSSIYLDTWKLTDIVEVICDTFTLSEKDHHNEAISTSDSSQHDQA